MVSGARLTPRAQLRSLLGRAGRRHPVPLFAPLTHALAAKVEALDIGECLTNPTKLAKGLQALHQALATDAITCVCDAAIELEVLGARTDWTSYPPRVVAPPALDGLNSEAIAERVGKALRMAAAVEATRRLAATCPGEPALLAAFTGPASLAVQIAVAEGDAAPKHAAFEAYLETGGRTVLEAARQFLLAGANVIMLLEEVLPERQTSSFDVWRSVINPIANLTRFHRALPIVLASWTSEHLGALPATIVPCLRLGGSTVEAGRSFGVALPTGGLDWQVPRLPCSVLTTDGELPFKTDIPALRDACEGVRMQIRAMGAHPE